MSFIIEIITAMSPIEIAAVLLTFTSQYLLTKKNWWGFVISIIGNICWMVGVGAPSIVLINSIFIVINIKGIISYRYTQM